MGLGSEAPSEMLWFIEEKRAIKAGDAPIALNFHFGQDGKYLVELENGDVKLVGSAAKVNHLVFMLDTFDFWFNIVTP